MKIVSFYEITLFWHLKKMLLKKYICRESSSESLSIYTWLLIWKITIQ